MSDDDQLTSRTIGHAFNPNTPLPMSPRIGTADTADGLSLDEIEYAAPSGEYWVQNCLWLKEPRVKQFMRPKFWAIPLALIFTSVFLAIAAVLISVKHSTNNDLTSPITQETSPTTETCDQIAWPVGWILIRDPFNVKRLTTIAPNNSSLLNYFDITEWDYIATFNGSAILFYGPEFPLLSNDTQIGALGTPDTTGHQFNSWGYLSTIWDVTTTKAWWGHLILPVDFSGASVTIPITPLDPNPPTSVSSTAGGAPVSSTGSPAATASSTGANNNNAPSSTGGNSPFNPFLSSTGRDFNPFSVVHEPQQKIAVADISDSTQPIDHHHQQQPPASRFHLMATSTAASSTSTNSSSSTSSSSSTTSTDPTNVHYYLFNNRTNVHVNGYYVIPQTQPSAPVASSTGVNNANNTYASSSTGVDWSSSSTGVAGNATNSTTGPVTPPPHVVVPTLPSVLPLYTLRLFPQYNGSLPLLMICGSSFTIPVTTSSSSTGIQQSTTPVTYYSSTAASSSTGVRSSSSSSTGTRASSSTGTRASSTGAAAASSTSDSSTAEVSSSTGA